MKKETEERQVRSEARENGGPWTRRKFLIVIFLAVTLLPMFLFNSAEALRQAGWKNLAWPAKATFRSHHALLLCQHWTLFSAISDFNFTTHVAVQLKDGTIRNLADPATEFQGDPWAVLFHSETKTQNNLYSDTRALRRYAEYLIRQHEIDPDDIVGTKVYIFYWNQLSREEAKRTGSLYGPEEIAELLSF